MADADAFTYGIAEFSSKWRIRHLPPFRMRIRHSIAQRRSEMFGARRGHVLASMDGLAHIRAIRRRAGAVQA